MLMSIVGTFSLMLVILCMCQLNTFLWHISYRASWHLIGLALSQLVQLFLALQFEWTCLLNMVVYIRCSTLAIFVRMWALYRRSHLHRFHLMMQLPVNMK